MQEHLHSSRALLDCGLFHRDFEPAFLHSFQKDRRFVAAGVGEDRLAAGRQELRYEIGEGGGVLALVQYICGEYQIEGPETLQARFAPVEGGDLRFQVQVRAGIVDRKVEGGLVVVGREHARAPGQRQDGRQSDAAPQLDGVGARKVASCKVACQSEGTGPEFCPVGEPFVAVEVVFVDQVVRRDGMYDAVPSSPELEGGFS